MPDRALSCAAAGGQRRLLCQGRMGSAFAGFAGFDAALFYRPTGLDSFGCRRFVIG